MDMVLEKVESKARDVFAQLSKMWMYLNKIVKTGSGENDSNEPVEIDIEEVLKYTQQTVLLLGQTMNTITYHRRYNDV